MHVLTAREVYGEARGMSVAARASNSRLLLGGGALQVCGVSNEHEFGAVREPAAA